MSPSLYIMLDVVRSPWIIPIPCNFFTISPNFTRIQLTFSSFLFKKSFSFYPSIYSITILCYQFRTFVTLGTLIPHFNAFQSILTSDLTLDVFILASRIGCLYFFGIITFLYQKYLGLSSMANQSLLFIFLHYLQTSYQNNQMQLYWTDFRLYPDVLIKFYFLINESLQLCSLQSIYQSIRQYGKKIIAPVQQFQQLIDNFIMSKRKDQTQQSDEEDDDNSALGEKVEIRKPKIQRLDKFKNLKKIVINVSMTQYPVVSEVAEDLGWKIQTSNDAGDWDVYWTDFSVDPDVLIKMHLFQKINHYPGIYVIARKNLLGHNLTKMGKRFPNQYNFFPMTWMLPQQYGEFRQFYESKQKGKTRTYIVKPEADCQGRGIFLTRKIEDMETGKHYVVQRYMARPYLLDGLKFDMRIYVLMCGTDPLKLYLYNEGLARLATETYHEPMNANLDKLCMHLTNYAINKFNPNFIFNNNVNNMGIGHKRALSCVMKQLSQKGLDVEVLKQKIKDVIIKTIISGLPLMSHQYKFSQPEDYSGNMCFHILGLDIMLNSKGEPFVLEVNHTPSFTTDTPLDHKIKFSLIKDTLKLMNVNVKTKNQLYNRCKQYNEQRLLTGKRHIYEGQQRQTKIKEAQEQREKYQVKHLGGFQKIYPLDNPQKNLKYEEMIGAAMSMYMEENQAVRARYEEKQMKKLMRSQLKVMKKNVKQKEKKQQKKDSEFQVKQENKSMISLPVQKNQKEKIRKQTPIPSSCTPRSQSLSLSQPVPKMSTNGSNLMNRQTILKTNELQEEISNTSQIQKVNKIKKFNRENSHTASRKQKSQKSIQQSKIFNSSNAKAGSKRSTPSQLRRSFKNNPQKQLPNIQSGTTGLDLLQGADQISQIRKIEKMTAVHNKFMLKSEPKPNRNIQSMEKDLKQFNQRKLFNAALNNGGFVMPKIFAIAVDPQKQQRELNFLSMGRKIQSSIYPVNNI